MKILIPGGSGQLGALLRNHLELQGHSVVVLARHPRGSEVLWDGKSLGPWEKEVSGTDVVINLAGRTVNCRYTEKNLREMLDSRVDSTRVVGEAIRNAERPPRVWLQMSTATVYAHRLDAPNDEHTGIIGGHEPGVPAYWRRSIDIAQAWEQTLAEAATPHTRKVALRTAMVMTGQRDGVFDVLSGLARKGLGGAIGGGHQFVSFIHGDDFAGAIDFLIAREDLAGAVNLAAPHPLPQREMMAALRRALGVRMGLPATRWMAELGAFFLRTDTELVLKSRRVIPTRLLEAGFQFRYPTWERTVASLVR